MDKVRAITSCTFFEQEQGLFKGLDSTSPSLWFTASVEYPIVPSTLYLFSRRRLCSPLHPAISSLALALNTLCVRAKETSKLDMSYYIPKTMKLTFSGSVASLWTNPPIPKRETSPVI